VKGRIDDDAADEGSDGNDDYYSGEEMSTDNEYVSMIIFFLFSWI